ILHSSLLDEPNGVPSSKYARRYHLPSHAFLFMFSSNNTMLCLHTSANSSSPRKLASFIKRFSTSYRKNPSHTLSPFPPIPTIFIPSFQSPEPMKGKPCSPNRSACVIARLPCSYSVAFRSEIIGRS